MVLKKGEVAPFDGALLPESEMRAVVKDSSFRTKVEPALNEPLDEKPLNFECAGIAFLLGFLSAYVIQSR